MQLGLGSKGAYAVRAVLDLATAHGDARRKGRDIARAMDIPPKFLSEVVRDLIGAGLIRSVPGRSGGYTLTRPPSTISLLEVVEATQGPIATSTCLIRGGACRRDRCAIHEAWASAQDKAVAELERVTFADLSRAHARSGR